MACLTNAIKQLNSNVNSYRFYGFSFFCVPSVAMKTG